MILQFVWRDTLDGERVLLCHFNFHLFSLCGNGLPDPGYTPSRLDFFAPMLVPHLNR